MTLVNLDKCPFPKRLWLSPHCLGPESVQQLDLVDALDAVTKRHPRQGTDK